MLTLSMRPIQKVPPGAEAREQLQNLLEGTWQSAQVVLREEVGFTLPIEPRPTVCTVRLQEVDHRPLGLWLRGMLGSLRGSWCDMARVGPVYS